MPDDRKEPESQGPEIDPGIIELPFNLADITSGIGDGEAAPIVLLVGLVLVVPILIFGICRFVWRGGRCLARGPA